MDYYEVRVCESCLLHVYENEEECPRCGSNTFGTVLKRKWADPDNTAVSRSVQQSFAMAKTLLRSDIECWWCNVQPKHYLVWPRAEIDGGKKRLTNLPHCPVRVMKYALGIEVPLEIILEELKVNNE